MSLIYSFEKYCFKVFRLAAFLGLLEDARKGPDIDIKNIVLGCLYAAALRIKAISAIEEETREGVLKKRIEPISDDTIAYGLEHLVTQSLQLGWYMLAKWAKRNGMLRLNSFHDYIVGVLDGIETYSSYKRHCDNCLTRKVTTKKGEKTQYYHKSVVLTLVGYDFPIPIGLEMIRKGENEVSCGLRLLHRIVENLGKRFLDILIADAFYCTPHFFEECEEMGIIPGAVLKENQENLLESAKAQKKISQPVICQEDDKEKLQLWDMKGILWETADRDVRVIWADREVLERDEYESKTWKWEKKKKVFVFSETINHLPSKVVYSIGRHRWDIDAKLFMDMVKHWHLKHKTLHFVNAYENMLSIRLISYLPFMFFQVRHINSRRKNQNKIKSYIEMARMLYRSACCHLEPEIILLE